MDERRSCPNMVRCRLFPRFEGSPTLRVLRVMYCENDFERCERYRRSQAGVPVPDELLPTGRKLGANGRPASSTPRSDR